MNVRYGLKYYSHFIVCRVVSLMLFWKRVTACHIQIVFPCCQETFVAMSVINISGHLNNSCIKRRFVFAKLAINTIWSILVKFSRPCHLKLLTLTEHFEVGFSLLWLKCFIFFVISLFYTRKDRGTSNILWLAAIAELSDKWTKDIRNRINCWQYVCLMIIIKLNMCTIHISLSICK